MCEPKTVCGQFQNYFNFHQSSPKFQTNLKSINLTGWTFGRCPPKCSWSCGRCPTLPETLSCLSSVWTSGFLSLSLHYPLTGLPYLAQPVHLYDHYVLGWSYPGGPGHHLSPTVTHGNGEEVGGLALSRLNISRLIMRVSGREEWAGED